jgi:hypothetical protein
MPIPNELRVRALALGRSLGVPMDAAVYLVQLENRIAELEKKVAALEGPPHLQAVERRAK